MMYNPRFVDQAAAPKTWADLLDARWAGQIGFQNSSAGSQYGWWYVLKDVLPAEFWTKLAQQKPRAYGLFDADRE
jgi:ABC-type Fe3+ transport system substrate-binding protein